MRAVIAKRLARIHLSLGVAALMTILGACEAQEYALPTPTFLPPASFESPELHGLAVETICLEVEQTYPSIEAKSSEPIAEAITQLLSGLGMRVVSEGEACEATMQFTLVGQPVSMNYMGIGTCYSAAHYEGNLRFTIQSQPPLSIPFEGHTEPPEVIRSVSLDQLECEPAEAPFDMAWSNGLNAVFYQMWGIRSLVVAAGVLDLDGSQGFATGSPLRTIDRTALMALYVQELANTNADVRAEATIQLSRFGPEAAAAVPLLISNLRHTSAILERTNVSIALSSITGHSFGEDFKAWEQWWHTFAFPNVETDVATLTERLNHEERMIRSAAIDALKQLGPDTPGVISSLMQALEHEDDWTVTMGVKALGAMGPQAIQAVPVLIEALAGAATIPWVRESAAQSLAQICSSAPEEAAICVPPLASLLESSSDWITLETVIEVLEGIGHGGSGQAELVAPLLLQIFSKYAPDNMVTAEQARAAAIQLMQQDAASAQNMLPTLRQILLLQSEAQNIISLETLLQRTHETPVMAGAVTALLFEHLGSEDSTMADFARSSLFQLANGEPEVTTAMTAALLDKLTSEETTLHVQALQLLMGIENVETSPQLVDTLGADRLASALMSSLNNEEATIRDAALWLVYAIVQNQANAAALIDAFGAENTASFLIELLSDENDSSREELAATMLLQLDTVEDERRVDVVPILIQALSDETLGWHKRSFIGERIVHMAQSNEEAARMAVASLVTIYLEQADPVMQGEQLQVLGDIVGVRPETAIDVAPVFANALRHPLLASIVVGQLPTIIEQIPSDTAIALVPDLMLGLGDPSELVRIATANSLGMIGPSANMAVPALQEALAQTSSATEESALQAAVEAITAGS